MYRLPNLEVDDHELEMISRALTGIAYLLNKDGKQQEAKKHLIVAAKVHEVKVQYQESLLPALSALYKIETLEIVGSTSHG